MIFIVVGSNYENASMPRERLYKKRDGLEQTRDNQQEGDPNDLDNLLPSRQRCSLVLVRYSMYQSIAILAKMFDTDT